MQKNHTWGESAQNSGRRTWVWWQHDLSKAANFGSDQVQTLLLCSVG
jgi:hypothetical protein